MNNYIKVTIDKYDDGLMALLSLLPFESFEETDESRMVCYIQESEYTTEHQQAIEVYLDMFSASYTKELILPKNWNAEWESNFNPVEVDDFCRIRADFHESVNDFDFELMINPKMAFGTGHHETTHMMIQSMRYLDFSDKKVFDYGCGTGVLAILASKLGANIIDAIDIENESYLNTIENCNINDVSNIHVACSEIGLLAGNIYDIILANINRQVLLTTSLDLAKMLNDNGILLISGILEQDKDKVLDNYLKAGFLLEKVNQRGKWLCIKFKR
jgi:ribosomal protein L11 methyltransferase